MDIVREIVLQLSKPWSASAVPLIYQHGCNGQAMVDLCSVVCERSRLERQSRAVRRRAGLPDNVGHPSI